MNTYSVMIVGVGGQGTLLASRLLGNAVISAGYDVKVSEVHGMSQRGGSVVTYVKYGKEVYSPIIDKGEADVILAFEQLEAIRWLPYLKKGGTVITNVQKINPMPVVFGAAKYPDNILEVLAKVAKEAQLTEKYEALYNGEVINTGEKRRVLHQLTRGQLGDAVVADGVDKRAFYVEQQNRIAEFAKYRFEFCFLYP